MNTISDKGAHMTDELWLLVLVCASFLTTSDLMTQMTGRVLLLTLFAVFLLWAISTKDIKIICDKEGAILYFTLVFILILASTIQSPISGIVRLFVFVSFTTMLLFILLTSIDYTVFWRYYSYLSTSLVVVAIPTLFIPEVGIGPIQITAWRSTLTIPLIGEVNTLSSIFSNSNHLALVCAFSVVSLISTQKLSKTSVGMVLVNAMGVMLAQGDAAKIAMILGVGMYLIYHIYNRQVVTLLSSVGIMGILGGTLSTFGIVYGPERIQDIDLSGRRMLWTASSIAVQEQPFLGHGMRDLAPVLRTYGAEEGGPHNSFIRIAVHGGIFSGLIYILLHVRYLYQRTDQSGKGAVYGIMWCGIVLQFFTEDTIFGLSSASLLFAVALGMGLKQVHYTRS